ncbi:hypothetical protein GCM10010435_50490 [Winogradskya consettensis]|uniref:Uncharacterized protein n=1 Tax=Winogradskya consettensis TaxID=113560 RepID=A0A919SYS1_9ACTN|nr:hypothetical protein Aco04nite_69390 [Actinoplanes consettensis]
MEGDHPHGGGGVGEVGVDGGAGPGQGGGDIDRGGGERSARVGKDEHPPVEPGERNLHAALQAGELLRHR